MAKLKFFISCMCLTCDSQCEGTFANEIVAVYTCPRCKTTFSFFLFDEERYHSEYQKYLAGLPHNDIAKKLDN